LKLKTEELLLVRVLRRMMMGELLPFQLGDARKIFILIFDNVILGSLLV
jgi:hypothetical protein